MVENRDMTEPWKTGSGNLVVAAAYADGDPHKADEALSHGVNVSCDDVGQHTARCVLFRLGGQGQA